MSLSDSRLSAMDSRSSLGRSTSCDILLIPTIYISLCYSPVSSISKTDSLPLRYDQVEI